MFRDIVNTQFALLGTLLRQNALNPYDASFILYTDERGSRQWPDQAGNVIVRQLSTLKARTRAQHTSLLEDLWWFGKAVPAAIAADRVTVFVSPYYRAPRAQVPVINMVHDLSFLVLRRDLLPAHLQNRIKRSVMRRLFQFYCRRVVSHTIAVSEYSKQCVIDHLCMEPERISVCYNGVDTNRLAAARHQVDREAGGTSGSYLLYVGYNSPNKNLDGLLRAYALLSPGFRAANPLVLRTRPGSEQAVLHGHGLKSTVRYLSDHLSDAEVATLVAGAKVLILVSHDEGFGLPAIEALAAGVPVVVSAGGALSEVTQRSMIEVDPRDPHSIADGIARAVERSRSPALQARCREIASRYSIKRAADDLMDVIRQWSREP
jgi:glycosyltransferase involved in cell wall biosynthesis